MPDGARVPTAESLQGQVSSLAEKVARLDGLKEGSHRATVISIALIGILGIATIIQLASSAIQSQVSEAVDSRAESILGDLQARVASAGDAALRAEVAAQGAASSAATAEAAMSGLLAIATEESLATQPGEWIVAVSSVETIDEAVEEVNRAVRAEYPVSVYHFGGAYVIAVGPYPDKNTAETTRPALARTLRGSPQVYDLMVHCPVRAFVQDFYYECSLVPSPTP